jgi:hypothetical protein
VAPETRAERYRLAPVRDAREREEHTRRGDLAAAVGEAGHTLERLDTARARTAAAREAVARAVTSRTTLFERPSTPAQLVLADDYVLRRRHELDRAIGEELRAEAAHEARVGTLDEARHRLARTRADREVIERHFARWRLARRKLAERRED